MNYCSNKYNWKNQILLHPCVIEWVYCSNKCQFENLKSSYPLVDWMSWLFKQISNENLNSSYHLCDWMSWLFKQIWKSQILLPPVELIVQTNVNEIQINNWELMPTPLERSMFLGKWRRRAATIFPLFSFTAYPNGVCLLK